MFTKSTLQNGLRILTAPLHDTKVVTVLIMFKVGSRYETRNINGISHFLEHLFFKGTKRRPSTLDISKTLDGVGADFNAFTSKDYTGYYIKLQFDKFELALDMLSDMLLNSLFDPKEIERERGVIIEEINMYEDNPMSLVEEHLERLMYGDTPLGWSIAGPKQTIEKITREQILDYRTSHYHAGNTLIAVSGKLPKNATERIKRYFGGNKFPKKKSLHFKTAVKPAKGPHMKLTYKKTEQVHVAFGWPALKYTHPDRVALQLLMIVLGGNMSSRLFISVRERQGLCYFIRGSVNPYEDIGNVVIQAGIDKTRIYQAITAIMQEVKILIDNGVTVDELRKAKDFLKGKLVLQLEDSEDLASWIVRQELFHAKTLTAEQFFEQLEKVTLQDLEKVAKSVFKEESAHLAVIGPYKEAAQFKSLLHF